MSGELPPLASDDPAWVAARRREWAAGQRPSEQEKPARLTSSALGAVETRRAVLDVRCRGRHVARVLVPDPDVALPTGVVLQVACEVRPVAGGLGFGWWPLDGYLGERVVIAACRCGHPHSLIVNRLVAEARGIKPGAPKRMDMRRVAAPVDAQSV